MPLFRILLFLLFFLSINLYGQDFIRVDHDEFVGNNIEGKKFLRNISKAKKLFNKGESSSLECLSLLLECNEFNNSNPELNYNIGLCYLMYGKKDLAKPYFEKTKVLKPNLNTDLYLFLGQACQYAQDFTNAILNYKVYVEILQHEGVKRNRVKLKTVSRYIDECKNGQVLAQQPLSFNVEEMPSPINSDANDILAIKDGVKLFFNSDRTIVGDKKKDVKSSFLRGFSVALINGEWSNFSVLNDEKKSNDLPLLVAKIDDNQYLFYDKDKGFGDLIFMQKDEKFWTKEMDAFFVNEKKSNESSASMTADGNELVFVSDRDGGQNDIFYCRKDDDGKWSKPVKLGEQINSEFDESDVFLSENGSVIYFSSKGRNTIGGYDIFRSEKDENGNWMEAKNMGMPINSPYDDRHFFPYDGGSFLFDSNRGENGKFDIYSKKLVVDKVIEEEVAEPIDSIEPIGAILPVDRVEILPEVIPVPIPIIEKVTPILISYKIQIAASKIAMKDAELRKLYQGKETIESSYDGEWYRYTIGNFERIEDAIYLKDRSRVDKAFIVSFENDIRRKIISNYSLYKRS
ncbi:SPOR domain-containing protein [Ancylomarina salipaludis]|uniref:SPOR domain-containing protein n=1 Tax=Ancylomarina salipaludis TaxID=2501299 RepID=A0A4V1MZY6_9BACT|nr:SPOR domain-containing protein [Ancylomarina salipaludis]RXQ91574.1 SPOR domain-containing protein [Ancylomarina salipaludis]